MAWALWEPVKSCALTTSPCAWPALPQDTDSDLSQGWATPALRPPDNLLMGNVVEIEHKTSLGLIQQTAAAAFNLEMG